MTKIEFKLAEMDDDKELRRILRETPMQGEISLSFEREPNYFIGATVEAPKHQIIVCNDLETKKIVGLGTRSLRPLYINGEVITLGYLSQFRIDPNYSSMRKGLTSAWQHLRKLHQDGLSPFYYTSIIEDNLPARRLLTRGLPGLPRYIEYARMHTLAIYARKKKSIIRPNQSFKITQGSVRYRSEILDCLHRNHTRYQFAPYWDDELIFNDVNTPGLAPEDFLIALRDDQVVGCLALWDQGAFKQTIIRGYSRRLRIFRKAYNLTAGVIGLPNLPPVNSKVKHAYASFLAVDHDELVVYQSLLRNLYNHAVERGYSYFMLGLCDDHPFLPYTKDTYKHIDYTSLIYLVTWDFEFDPRSQLDDRLPAPEIAIL